MKILLIGTDLDIGGTPLQVYRLAKGLTEAGATVFVACLAGPGPVADKIRAIGVEVYPLGAKNIRDIGVLYRLSDLIRRLGPDLCHSFLMHANIATRLSGLITASAPVVSTICTVERQKRWHMVLECMTARLADRIVCISKAVNDFCLRSHLPANRLTIIRPGIELEKITSAHPIEPAALNLNPAFTRICYLGRLDPIKRVDLVLRALKTLDRSDLDLLIIGDGPERTALERLAGSLNIADRVHFLGFRDDYPDILKSCKLYVLASQQEGWGVATTEALAAGLVVVATDVDANSEQVLPGKTGFLVPPDSPAALARAIDQGLALADSPERQPPTDQFLQTLSYRRESDQYLQLYQQLLSSRKFAP